MVIFTFYLITLLFSGLIQGEKTKNPQIANGQLVEYQKEKKRFWEIIEEIMIQRDLILEIEMNSEDSIDFRQANFYTKADFVKFTQDSEIIYDEDDSDDEMNCQNPQLNLEIFTKVNSANAMKSSTDANY
ncbi:MAG: hypothetical protein EZS28_024761 [Streblomastix strix]|uniref:Uncharacterized protein n=1 Tax=Streblomastix strix TaxID=222440 RepID=A0A5J4VB85_9EUKA|nr:MAG: hypothetical protein EZS28_024761 [Streblomastix strix]